MNEIIHADIFFFVSTIVVIVLAPLGVVALVFAIKGLRDFAAFARRVRQEGDAFAQDVSELRETVKRHQGKIATALSAFFLFKKRRGGAHSKTGDERDRRNRE